MAASGGTCSGWPATTPSPPWSGGGSGSSGDGCGFAALGVVAVVLLVICLIYTGQRVDRAVASLDRSAALISLANYSTLRYATPAARVMAETGGRPHSTFTRMLDGGKAGCWRYGFAGTVLEFAGPGATLCFRNGRLIQRSRKRGELTWLVSRPAVLGVLAGLAPADLLLIGFALLAPFRLLRRSWRVVHSKPARAQTRLLAIDLVIMALALSAFGYWSAVYVGRLDRSAVLVTSRKYARLQYDLPVRRVRQIVGGPPRARYVSSIGGAAVTCLRYGYEATPLQFAGPSTTLCFSHGRLYQKSRNRGHLGWIVSHPTLVGVAVGLAPLDVLLALALPLLLLAAIILVPVTLVGRRRSEGSSASVHDDEANAGLPIEPGDAVDRPGWLDES